MTLIKRALTKRDYEKQYKIFEIANYQVLDEDRCGVSPLVFWVLVPLIDLLIDLGYEVLVNCKQGANRYAYALRMQPVTNVSMYSHLLPARRAP